MSSSSWLHLRELKRDGLNRIELLTNTDRRLVRRVACGGGVPGSRLLARWLLRRERRALALLAGLPQIPRLAADPDAVRLPGSDGRSVQPRDVLLRTWLAGEPLCAVEQLPTDYFARLTELVQAIHARGVCHNDLHKENNLLVLADQLPGVVDFQLASVHRVRGRRFRMACREDLRHVEKHRRRYVAMGAPIVLPPRSLPAALWMRLGKPLYNLITRHLLRRRRGEPRRLASGPWPRRTHPAAGTQFGDSSANPWSAPQRSHSQ